MQLKHAGALPAPARKTPKLREKDVAEYERTRSEIIKVLENVGGYEQAIDGILVAQIAITIINLKNIEFFIDSDLATSDTYASVIDTKLKMAKMIENAIRQLALSRRDRIGNQSQSSLINQLKQGLEEVLKNGER